MKLVFKLHITIVLLLKKLYKKKNRENTFNALLASSLLIFVNTLTIFGILNHYFSFFDIKYNPDYQYRGAKILVGTILIIIYIWFMDFIRKKLTFMERTKLYRKLIERTPSKWISLMYITFSVTGFILVLVKFYL